MGASVKTHYQTLSVEHQADPDLLRRAYRRQAQKYHPDKAPGDREAEQKMAQINEAYAVLSNPARRATYDRWIEARHARIAAERRAQIAGRPSRFSAAWPWTLLFATIACAVLAVGTVLFISAVRPVAPPLNTAAGFHKSAAAHQYSAAAPQARTSAR
ncbi:MAG: J domain-containing protein [Comamonadaceae bacterium]|nr:MAG: J domain-containing protein [Comamonadaceae bacterium]